LEFLDSFLCKTGKKEVHETEDMSVIVKQLSTLGDVECLMQVLYLDGGTAKTVLKALCISFVLNINI
jgi:hypothetical protein